MSDLKCVCVGRGGGGGFCYFPLAASGIDINFPQRWVMGREGRGNGGAGVGPVDRSVVL